MAKPKTKDFEVTFAVNFLKAAGMSNPQSNVYLVLAVIAWLRSESGTRYIGNNPLNLRPGADIAKYVSGRRKAGNNGYFATFASLAIAAKASAARLKSDGANGWRGYGMIIRAIKRGASASAKSQQGQAIDFLTAIALSKWDAGHYGTFDKDPAEYDGNKNRLIKVWLGLTGAPVVFPDPHPPKPIRPPKPKKVQPDDKLYLNVAAERIDPYHSIHWLRERDRPEPGVPGGNPSPV